MVVRRVVRDRVSAMAADSMGNKLAEKSIGNDGGVVLLPLSPH